MSDLTITYRQAVQAGAWGEESLDRMADHLGGRPPLDEPITITTVLDVLGLDDALWALDAIGERRLLREWACDCAERALPVWERCHPDDRRLHEAIRVARLHARGMATAAAMGAACDAARDAEREWQEQRLRELVSP